MHGVHQAARGVYGTRQELLIRGHVEDLNQRILWERKAWSSGDISEGEVMI